MSNSQVSSTRFLAPSRDARAPLASELAMSSACMTSVLDLAALEDGTLSTAGRRRLVAHLAICGACQAVHDTLCD